MKQLKDLFVNRDYLFWFLNLSGWAGWALTSYLAGRYWGVKWGLIDYRLVGALIGLFICVLLRRLYQRIWNSSLAVRLIAVLAVSYICAALMAAFTNFYLWNFHDDGYVPSYFMKYFKGVTHIYYVFLCWSGLYFGFKFYQGMQEATQKALKANSLAHQAQLKMLRYQLNPHFLFNTLNAISTLVLEQNTKRANDMVTRLSNFLRYSLDNDPMQKVTLSQEINALKLYLGIEKVRFEERLVLSFDIEEQANEALIPSLLLQPMVENSIKYAIAKAENGGTITIKAKVFARELLLELSDDGPGIKLVNGEIPNGLGVGVRNTRERLSELYGDKHAFELSNRVPNGLQVSIRIPYEKEKV
ncbi:sensor histidine kinase [Pleionea sp. CnH1-48]|uniref:sensor histidine kinase n=1 Tax=Pleionea sp. CnH1-48 TaxID=2954494 RepID=UPI0020974C48|nr:histidine kinase [Pleionea sp. CnH1-48]MCO7226693.1 histidine kinase [Pleionea sp. CnH1-48]